MKEKVAKLLLPRGSYGDDWYDHWGDCGGGGGWWTGSPGSPDNPYELPEAIVTPSGNHVDYSNSDFDYNYGNGYYGDENSYLWHQDGNYDDRNDGGGGGGDSSDYYDSTEANILSHGQTAVNVITNSIQDNTAIWCKYVQETKGFQLLSATSFASGVPNFQYDLITALKADEGIVRTLGTAMVKGNTILSSGIALIGLADGDVTTADLLSALSAGIGILGMTTSVAPPVALTLDGISFVLSIASTYLSQQQNGNPSSY